jgi:hypothetical protein
VRGRFTEAVGEGLRLASFISEAKSEDVEPWDRAATGRIGDASAPALAVPIGAIRAKTSKAPKSIPATKLQPRDITLSTAFILFSSIVRSRRRS